MTERTVKINVKGDVSDFNRAMLAASASSKAFADSLDSSRNQMSGLIQLGLALGPALVPIGATAVPVITGLANQLGLAAGAAGVTVVAFQGVGTALQDLNDYRLKPTNANLLNLQNSMQALSPAGRDLVAFLQDLRPEMSRLQDIAQEGMFPGLMQGLDELKANKPLIEGFFATVSQTVGDLFAEAGDNLNDPRWQEFFAFLDREARPTLEAMARTLGNFTEGLAQMWMAFEPLNDRFSAGFLEMSRDFANWSAGLSQNAGFQDFMAYIERVGPQVADTLGAFAGALVSTAKAAAEVGDVALPVLELLADALSGLMSSPIGAPLLGLTATVAALSTLKRVATFGNFAAIGNAIKTMRDLPPVVGTATRSWLNYDVAAGRAMGRQGPLTEGMKRLAPSVGKTGALVAGLAFTMSDLDDKIGLAHASSFALTAGFATGSPLGAALGFAAGAVVDLAGANDDLFAAIERASAAAGNSSVSYADQAAALDVAKQKLDDLKAAENAYSNPAGGGGGIGSRIKGAKSLIEGFFGKSDSEEGAAAIKAAAAATQAQKFAEMGMTSVMDGASQSLRDHTEAIYDDIAAKRALVTQDQSSISGEIAWEAAIDSTNKTLKENGRNINIDSQAGRENVTAVQGMISTWNGLDPAAQKARGGMAAARKAVYAAAIMAGYGKKEAKGLADQLIDLGKLDPKPKIDVQSNAKEVVARAREYLKGLKDETVYIHVIRRLQGKSTHPGPEGPTWMGGPVGYADGGLIPGSPPSNPRVDDLFGLVDGKRVIGLRSGEFIMNEPATKRFEPLFRAINEGSMRGLAAGGATADGPRGTFADAIAAFAPIDEKTLERAFRNALHGSEFNFNKDGRRLALDTRRG